ncbi:uncharacterized protein [Dendrobates tinctorius]|uniref:uncharacterized protein isoform X2 n=1 Tax=Dendrobates tinctorius TaxID=92724 RepID=UPI003CC99BBF
MKIFFMLLIFSLYLQIQPARLQQNHQQGCSRTASKVAAEHPRKTLQFSKSSQQGCSRTASKVAAEPPARLQQSILGKHFSFPNPASKVAAEPPARLQQSILGKHFSFPNPASKVAAEPRARLQQTRQQNRSSLICLLGAPPHSISELRKLNLRSFQEETCRVEKCKEGARRVLQNPVPALERLPGHPSVVKVLHLVVVEQIHSVLPNDTWKRLLLLMSTSSLRLSNHGSRYGTWQTAYMPTNQPPDGYGMRCVRRL